jgi:hypothetical protein
MRQEQERDLAAVHRAEDFDRTPLAPIAGRAYKLLRRGSRGNGMKTGLSYQ